MTSGREFPTSAPSRLIAPVALFRAGEYRCSRPSDQVLLIFFEASTFAGGTPCWLAGWVAGWLAGWLAGGRQIGRTKCRRFDKKRNEREEECSLTILRADTSDDGKSAVALLHNNLQRTLSPSSFLPPVMRKYRRGWVCSRLFVAHSHAPTKGTPVG